MCKIGSILHDDAEFDGKKMTFELFVPFSLYDS